MKVYVTKYALTQGILEKEVELPLSNSDTMVVERVPGQLSQFFHKPFWYVTREEAVTHAEQLRVRKIASLLKSIEKVQKLAF
jgi:hypothetical protein